MLELSVNDLKKELQELANPEKAKQLARFFKTGKGEYGEGDRFIGIVVPNQREVAKKYKDIDLSEIQKILISEIHEERLCALLILTYKYKDKKIPKSEKRRIFDLYLKNAKLNRINNWDLVDLSAPNIVGNFLIDRKEDRKILYALAKSNNLWEKRISILATFAFIREKDFGDSLKIAEILLNDKHDLIHKAVGWMLREIGKRDLDVEEEFLKKHYKKMPRTMLRYTIERFEEGKRQKYLNGEI